MSYGAAQPFQAVQAQTGSTYLVKVADHGKLLTNRGGGACTYTLPLLADIQAGWWVEFFVIAAGDQVITAPADSIVLLNDAAATTLTIGTNGEEIGNGVRVIYDGTSYLGFVSIGNEAVTLTVGA